MSETIGAAVKLSFDGKEVTAGFQNLANQIDQLNANVEKSSVSMSKLAAGNLIAKGLSAAFNAVRNSIGGAIARIDTLNNYSRMMEGLGFSANEAASSQEKLSKSIEGLPTTLDEIVGNTQMLVASVGDLGKATDLAVGLNDMFTASGQGSEAASRAMVQYNQMIARGKVDMQSWLSVVQTAPAQVSALAKELLGAEANQSDLYNALQSGRIAMSDLNDAIIKLDSQGGAGMTSFHDQAMAATDGIQTGITNLKTAVTKGVAKVIDEFNKAAKANGLPTIAEALGGLKKVVNNVFTAISNVVKKAVAVVAPVFQFLAKHIEAVKVVAAAALSGFLAWKAVNKITSIVSSVSAGLAKLAAKWIATTAAETANTAVKGAQIAATTAATAAETAQTMTLGGLTAAYGPATVAAGIFNTIMASTALTIGLVVGAVVAATAGIAALYNHFVKNNREYQQMQKNIAETRERTDELKESSQSVSEEVSQSYEAYQQQKKAYKKTTSTSIKLTNANEALADSEEDMTNATKARVAAEQELSRIDEEMTATKRDLAMYEQLDLDSVGSGMGHAFQDDIEIRKSYLEELRTQYYETADAVKESSAAEAEAMNYYNEALADSVEYGNTLHQEQISGEEHLNDVLRQLYDHRSDALRNAVTNQTATYADLSEANQQTIDDLNSMWEGYYDASTQMSDKINLNFDLTAQQMAENLGYNQQVVTAFKNNMNAIRAWADTLNPVDPVQAQMKDGFDLMLADMEQAGIDAAPQAQALVDAIAGGDMLDLANISIAYGAAGALAGEATVAGMDESAKKIAEQTKYMWGGVPKSISEVLNETDWGALSEKVAEDTLRGFVESVEKHSDGGAAILESFGLDSIDALKEALGVSSPSWKTAEAARYSVEGFTNGVNNGKGLANRAMQGLGSTVISALSWLPGSMYNAGANAIQGFVSGLNAMAGGVMRTAQAIANTVSSTIRSALQIHSPSKLMFGFGEYAGEGLAKGIERMEAVVEAASQRLAEASARVFAPTTEYSYSFSGAGGGSLQIPIQGGDRETGSQTVRVEGAVYLDGTKVGTLVAPHSRKAIAEIDTFENYRRGIR